MKLVLAFVQPFKLEAVTRSLKAVEGLSGLTVSDARGFGREWIALERDERAKLEDFTDKVELKLVVQDDLVDAVMDAIADAAHTGRYGDGVIIVMPVERAERIMNLKKGPDSL